MEDTHLIPECSWKLASDTTELISVQKLPVEWFIYLWIQHPNKHPLISFNVPKWPVFFTQLIWRKTLERLHKHRLPYGSSLCAKRPSVLNTGSRFDFLNSDSWLPLRSQWPSRFFFFFSHFWTAGNENELGKFSSPHLKGNSLCSSSECSCLHR